MAYDEDLAHRIGELLGEEPDVTERKMFGGLAFLVAGHMAVAVSREGGLMVRVAPDETDALLAGPHARPFEMRGRPMDGWLRVDADARRVCAASLRARRRDLGVGLSASRPARASARARRPSGAS